MSEMNLAKLGKAPVNSWYRDLSKKQEEVIVNTGGQLISSALNYRHEVAKLRTMLMNLPKAIMGYSQEEVARCGGLVIEVMEIAVHAASIGVGREEVSKLLGIPAQRFQTWLERGAEGEEPFCRLTQAFFQAEVLHDLNQEADAKEALALEVKTAGSYIALLKRRDEMRLKEKALFEDLPLSDFTDEEFEAYAKRGIVPERFKKQKDTSKDEAFARVMQLEAQAKILEEEVLRLKREAEKVNENAIEAEYSDTE
jgi:hypothetical protein